MRQSWLLLTLPILSSLLAWTVADSYNACNQSAEVVFVLDASSSVGEVNFQKVRTFTQDVTRRLRTEYQYLNITVITFSNEAQVTLQLTEAIDVNVMLMSEANIKYTHGGTETHKALNLMYQQFNNDVHSSKIAIVVTDGASFEPQLTRNAAKFAKDHGVSIFVIGIGDDVNQHETKDISSDPDSRFLYQLKSFSDLQSVTGVFHTQKCTTTTTPTTSTTTTTTPTPSSTTKQATTITQPRTTKILQTEPPATPIDTSSHTVSTRQPILQTGKTPSAKPNAQTIKTPSAKPPFVYVSTDSGNIKTPGLVSGITPTAAPQNTVHNVSPSRKPPQVSVNSEKPSELIHETASHTAKITITTTKELNTPTKSASTPYVTTKHSVTTTTAAPTTKSTTKATTTTTAPTTKTTTKATTTTTVPTTKSTTKATTTTTVPTTKSTTKATTTTTTPTTKSTTKATTTTTAPTKKSTTKATTTTTAPMTQSTLKATTTTTVPTKKSTTKATTTTAAPMTQSTIKATTTAPTTSTTKATTTTTAPTTKSTTKASTTTTTVPTTKSTTKASTTTTVPTTKSTTKETTTTTTAPTTKSTTKATTTTTAQTTKFTTKATTTTSAPTTKSTTKATTTTVPSTKSTTKATTTTTAPKTKSITKATTTTSAPTSKSTTKATTTTTAPTTIKATTTITAATTISTTPIEVTTTIKKTTLNQTQSSTAKVIPSTKTTITVPTTTAAATNSLTTQEITNPTTTKQPTIKPVTQQATTQQKSTMLSPPPSTLQVTKTTHMPTTNSTTRPTTTTTENPITTSTLPPTTTTASCIAKIADVVFVVDTSGSIGLANFEKVKAFIKEVILTFDVDTRYTWVGLIEYSTFPHIEFKLNEKSNLTDLLEAVENVTYSGGGTSTSDALQLMRVEGFERERPAAPDIAIVITDGLSKFPALTRAQANLAKKDGITMFSIGIGNETATSELVAIATNKHYVFEVGDYETLLTLDNVVAHRACGVDLPEEYHSRSTAKPTAPSKGCVDIDANCASYHRDSCSDYEPYARKNCPRKCGFCPGYPIVEPPCEDVKPDCASYGTAICLSSTQYEWADTNCRRHCSFCGNKTEITTTPVPTTVVTTAATCFDIEPKCAKYGGPSMCTSPSYKSWAKHNCAKYCGYCFVYHTVTGATVNQVKCPKWTLPEQCTLEYSAGSCCPYPKCPDGFKLNVKRKLK